MVGLPKKAGDVERDCQFDEAFALLGDMFDPREADEQFPVRGNAVYSTCVVVWMLVYQRMHPDKSLEAAVKHLIDSRPSFLPENKRVKQKTLSSNTSSFSTARKRLPREAAEWFSNRISQSLIEASQPTLQGRRVFLIDGTTMKLAPVRELQKAFPPAPNQYGPGVWPVALLTVAHELSSGAALNPEIGAKFGPEAVSETALVKKLMQRMPTGSVVMADSGFGIFAVAYDAAQAGHSFLFRLTQQRFNAYQKRATLIEKGERFKSYELCWQPSAQELKSHPEIAKDAVLNVRLHEVVISKDLTLCLASDLNATAKEVADGYKRRVDVEIDIRNVKVVMNTEQMRVRSVAMFHKELSMSMVAYNLVTQFRRQAAELAKRLPRQMSFKRTWTTVRIFLLGAMYTDPVSWRDKYEVALRYAMNDKLPNRGAERQYEREAYPHRPKANQFKKRKLPATAPVPES
jgi:hypothetical protein